MKKRRVAASPVLIGPANAEAITGLSWRHVREVAAKTPGIRVMRSGVAGRIAAVVAEDFLTVLAKPAEASAASPAPVAVEDNEPQTADEVLAIIGRKIAS